jgi:hypothetical protein
MASDLRECELRPSHSPNSIRSNLLEVVVLVTEDDRASAIHEMRMRAQVPEVVEVTREARSDGANSRVVTDAEIEAYRWRPRPDLTLMS